MSKQIIEFPILKPKGKKYVLTPSKPGAFSLEGLTPDQEVNEIIMGIIKAYKRNEGPKTYKQLEDEVLDALKQMLTKNGVEESKIEEAIKPYAEQVKQILPFVHGVFYTDEVPVYAKLRIRQRLLEMQNNTSLVRTSIDSELKKYFEVRYEKDSLIGLDNAKATSNKKGDYALPQISNGHFVITQDNSPKTSRYKWDTVSLVRVSKKTWEGFFKLLEEKVKGTELEEQVAKLKEELGKDKTAVLLDASGKDAPGLNESILSRLRSIFTRESFPEIKKDRVNNPDKSPKPGSKGDNGGEPIVTPVKNDDGGKPTTPTHLVVSEENPDINPGTDKDPNPGTDKDPNPGTDTDIKYKYQISYKYKGVVYDVLLDDKFNVLNKANDTDGRTLIAFDNAYDYYESVVPRLRDDEVGDDELAAHYQIGNQLAGFGFMYNPKENVDNPEKTDAVVDEPSGEPADKNPTAAKVERENPYNGERPYSRIRKKGRLQRFFLFFAHHWLPILAISAVAIVGSLAIAGIFPGAIPAAAAVFTFFSTGLSLYWPAFLAVGIALVGIGEFARRHVFKNRKRRRLAENRVLNSHRGLKAKLDKNIRSMKRTQKQILALQQTNEDILKTAAYDRTTGKQSLSRQQSRRYNNNIRKINQLFDKLHKYSRKAKNNVTDIDTHLAKVEAKEQKIIGSEKGPGIEESERLSGMGIKADIASSHELTLRDMILQNRRLAERAQQSAEKAQEMGVTTSGRVARDYIESIHKANEDIVDPLRPIGILADAQANGEQPYTDPVTADDTTYVPLGQRIKEALQDKIERRKQKNAEEAASEVSEAAAAAARAAAGPSATTGETPVAPVSGKGGMGRK